MFKNRVRHSKDTCVKKQHRNMHTLTPGFKTKVVRKCRGNIFLYSHIPFRFILFFCEIYFWLVRFYLFCFVLLPAKLSLKLPSA